MTSSIGIEGSHLYICMYTHRYICSYTYERASQVVLVVKNPPANAGDVKDAGLIPGSRRSPGGRHGNSLHILD